MNKIVELGLCELEIAGYRILQRCDRFVIYWNDHAAHMKNQILITIVAVAAVIIPFTILNLISDSQVNWSETISYAVEACEGLIVTFTRLL